MRKANCYIEEVNVGVLFALVGMLKNQVSELVIFTKSLSEHLSPFG